MRFLVLILEMTNPELTSRLLKQAFEAAVEQHPDLARERARFEALHTQAQQRDSKGNLTNKAHQARQAIRHPYFKTTHVNTGAKAAGILLKQTTAAAEKAIIEALVLQVQVRQAQLECDQYEAPVTDSDIPPSRELADDAAYQVHLFKKLIPSLIKHRVGKSTINRVPAFVNDLVARLYSWAHSDPQWKDPLNLWVAIAKSGVLEAYRSGMSVEEAAVIDTAVAMREEGATAKLMEVLSKAPSGMPPVSAELLLGCARLAEMSRELSPGEIDAYYESQKLLGANETKVVTELLGLDATEERAVAATISFLSYRLHDPSIDQFTSSFPGYLVRQTIENLDISNRTPGDWLPEFRDKIIHLAGQMTHMVRTEEVFWLLLDAAFQNSRAKIDFEQFRAHREMHAHMNLQREVLAMALESGKMFKFDQYGWAVTEDDEKFHWIPQDPMTRESYENSSTVEEPSFLLSRIDAESELDDDDPVDFPVGASDSETLAQRAQEWLDAKIASAAKPGTDRPSVTEDRLSDDEPQITKASLEPSADELHNVDNQSQSEFGLFGYNPDEPPGAELPDTHEPPHSPLNGSQERGEDREATAGTASPHTGSDPPPPVIAGGNPMISTPRRMQGSDYRKIEIKDEDLL